MSMDKTGSFSGFSKRDDQYHSVIEFIVFFRIQSLVKGVQMSNDKLDKYKDDLDSDEVHHLLEAHSVVSLFFSFSSFLYNPRQQK